MISLNRQCDVKQYFEYTRHKKIYKDAYWGHNRLREEDLGEDRKPHDERFLNVIANRDKFVTEKNIDRYYSVARNRVSICREFAIKITLGCENVPSYDIRDHIEYYKCKDKSIICIFSQGISNDDETLQLIYSHGYTMIEPLYSTDQKTFMKKIML
jgi:hypothetical protein